MLIDVSTGTVRQSHEKNAEQTQVINAVSLENKNFKEVKESIEKTISGVYIPKLQF